MSDDLEVRFFMPRKRRGPYDVEYIRIAVGLIRDGVDVKSLTRRPGASKETMEEQLLSYRIGGEAVLMNGREDSRGYDYEAKLAVVLDHLERGMNRPEVMGRYGIASRACLKQRYQNYRRGGPEALHPKLKGRPKSAKSKPRPTPTHEWLLGEENTYLEVRVMYLEKARILLVSESITGRSR